MTFMLFFFPDIEAPPSNWESLLARIPKNPKLLELEKEKIRLKKDSIQWPLVEPFNEAENRSTLSAKNILNALLKIHPLFAKAWELAEQPDLEEIPPEASEDPREHSRGNLAYYSLDSHKITIENGRTEVQKLSAMVFETINAIQRASFESVKKWDDLTREEYAFLSESVEYNSDYWRTIILRDPEAPSIDYKGLWKTHNISYAEGLISHAEAVRRRWDRVYFPRWLETHPEEFKKRLAELEQAHSLSSALTADGLKAK